MILGMGHYLEGGGLVQMEGGHVQILLTLPFVKHIFADLSPLPPFV